MISAAGVDSIERYASPAIIGSVAVSEATLRKRLPALGIGAGYPVSERR